ncbi:MAG: SDR family oxidoreductase [Gemmatimonadota bacterium]
MITPVPGPTALVTGATRGIGLATTRVLRQAGFRVLMLARDEARLREAASEAGPGSSIVLPCDLSRHDDIDRVIAAMTDQLGVPEVVVNNAGSFPLGAVGETTPAEFERAFELNTFGPWRLLHSLVPLFRRRGAGHIVTVGSVADRVAYSENAAYAATKFAMRAVHEVLRIELKGSGVRATLVSPGPVDTAIWDPVLSTPRPGFPSRTEMLRPADVAEAIAWTISRPPHVNIDELRLSRA